MDALQLESATPINLGAGLGFYFITLQSTDGTGQASTGSMTINFAGGTFTSSLDVFFDVHYGALNGPIVLAQDLVLSSSSTPWGNVAPAGATLVTGANYQLDGTDIADDFWPNGTFGDSGTGGTSLVESDVPEPSTYVALLMGAGAFLARRRTAAAA
jgi:hypothetical protein